MKRVLVTGGSRGVGVGILSRLLADGASVVTASRHLSPELEALVDSYPSQLEYYPVDFADPEGSGRLAKSGRLLNGVDAFVANAALGTEGLLTLTSERALREC